mmetsp:Transcript_3954/g.6085  ORF Transcript_3954/g.6085 Transcript_3954/m.6085 type:complete len:84 (+) Transcript_3954:826-1077(+)
MATRQVTIPGLLTAQAAWKLFDSAIFLNALYVTVNNAKKQFIQITAIEFTRVDTTMECNNDLILAKCTLKRNHNHRIKSSTYL